RERLPRRPWLGLRLLVRPGRWFSGTPEGWREAVGALRDRAQRRLRRFRAVLVDQGKPRFLNIGPLVLEGMRCKGDDVIDQARLIARNPVEQLQLRRYDRLLGAIER